MYIKNMYCIKLQPGMYKFFIKIVEKLNLKSRFYILEC